MKQPTKLSLGKLRPVNKKTKERSPVLIGTLLLQQSTLKCLIKQMNESRADDEIPCNLAGWFNDDAQGQYITVQLSPRFQRKEPEPPRSILPFCQPKKEEN